MKFLFISLFVVSQIPFLSGQIDTVYLKNPSFEDYPHLGASNHSSIRSWFDCGSILFGTETPPDVHPVADSEFEVYKSAADGNTYLGMVVRDNDSWESVAQRVSSPLQAGSCYSFTIKISMSETYSSASKQNTNRKLPYDKPAVLRLWGGDGFCGKKELLAESKSVTNIEWKDYDFLIEPSRSYSFIMLEVFYKTPTLLPYRGHILLDDASHFVLTPCDGEPLLAFQDSEEPKIQQPQRKPQVKANNPVQNQPQKKNGQAPVAQVIPAPQKESVQNKNEKLLSGLNRNQLTKGQKIGLEKLFFEADTTSMTNDSYEVIDELYAFLLEHRDIIVEIGGHTNGNPGISHQYCDQLSTDRAKSVAQYLVKKGISKDRLFYKGYGKRKPVASNRTREGRLKNQRVEITILKMDS